MFLIWIIESVPLAIKKTIKRYHLKSRTMSLVSRISRTRVDRIKIPVSRMIDWVLKRFFMIAINLN